MTFFTKHLRSLVLLGIAGAVTLQSYAQLGTLYGVTQQGGADNIGTIFKTDGTGGGFQLLDDHNLVTGGKFPTSGKLLLASDNAFYGMTADGGAFNNGVIYRFVPPSTYTIVHSFDFNTGGIPRGGLVEGPGGSLYGVASTGGTNSAGVLFRFNINTNTYSVLHNFDGTNNGALPSATPILIGGTVLAGSTSLGGPGTFGTLYTYDLAGNSFQVVHAFNGANGATMVSELFFNPLNNTVYGATQLGGITNHGVLFKVNALTFTYTKIHDFDSVNGKNPYASLVLANNNMLYGVAEQGGANNEGVLFRVDPTTDIYTVRRSFSNATGSLPRASLFVRASGELLGATTRGGTGNQGVIFTFDPLTDTYTVVENLANAPVGSNTIAPFIESSPGLFMTTANQGGPVGAGTIFDFDINSVTLTKLVDFGLSDGDKPLFGLSSSSNGYIYGVTEQGGSTNTGTVYAYDSLTNLLLLQNSFGTGTPLLTPSGKLMEASNGNLYGVASSGGLSGAGGIYEYSTSFGSFGFVYNMAVDPMGGNPYGELTEFNGNLYGTSRTGCANGTGGVFRFNLSNSAFDTVASFNALTGSVANGSLLLASNNLLYGTTNNGGTGTVGTIFTVNPLTNVMTVVYNFDSLTGSSPKGKLVQHYDGFIYGVTSSGGANRQGVIFRFNPANNTYTKLHDFGGFGGSAPDAGMVESSDLNLYGLTPAGGVNSAGVMYRFNPQTATYQKIIDFGNNNGAVPTGELLVLCRRASFTQQPQTLIEKCVGDSTLFSIVSANMGVTYQWYKDGVLIPGATNDSLFLYNITASDSGNYYCAVNNGCGPVNSQFGRLRVNFGDPVSLNIPVTNTCEFGTQIALSGESPTGGTFSGPGVSGTTFTPSLAGPGNRIIEYTIIAANGCPSIARDSIQVDQDLTAPVITNMPNNITINNDAGDCGAIVTWTLPNATDDCRLQVFSSDFNTGDFFPVGVTTVTYNAADSAGNSASLSFTVTVNDTEDPVFTQCTNQITGCVGTPIFYTDPIASDNCNLNVTRTQGLASGSLFPLGTTTMEFTATDPAGNSATCTFSIVADDCSVGIDNQEQWNVVVYPNPTANSIFVTYTAMDEVNRIEILDMQGRVVAQFNPAGAITYEMNVSSLSQGTYIVRLIGKQMMHQRFIKM